MNPERLRISVCLILCAMLLCGCGAAGAKAGSEESPAPAETAAATAAPGVSADPSPKEPVSAEETVLPALTAADLLEGTYEIETRAGYPLFRPARTELTVSGGKMTAVLYLDRDLFTRMYAGTADLAAAAPDADLILSEPGEETGSLLFTVDAAALDREEPFSIFGGDPAEWHDCPLLFCSDGLPADAFPEGSLFDPAGLPDGEYTAEVLLSGGSGKARIASPARLFAEDGKVRAEIVWSSSNYDFMIVGGERILPETTEGGSVFLIPVEIFDRPVPVSADTTAMSAPHLIDYTLRFVGSTVRKTD